MSDDDQAREEKTSAEWIASSLRALDARGRQGRLIPVEELVLHSHLSESAVRRALAVLIASGTVEDGKTPGRGRRAYVSGYRLKN